jgi:hypothetical protein
MGAVEWNKENAFHLFSPVLLFNMLNRSSRFHDTHSDRAQGRRQVGVRPAEHYFGRTPGRKEAMRGWPRDCDSEVVSRPGKSACLFDCNKERRITDFSLSYRLNSAAQGGRIVVAGDVERL